MNYQYKGKSYQLIESSAKLKHVYGWKDVVILKDRSGKTIVVELYEFEEQFKPVMQLQSAKG